MGGLSLAFGFCLWGANFGFPVLPMGPNLATWVLVMGGLTLLAT